MSGSNAGALGTGVAGAGGNIANALIIEALRKKSPGLSTNSTPGSTFNDELLSNLGGGNVLFP